MPELTENTLNLAKKLLRIQVIASLFTFAGVAAICKEYLGLEPLWSAIIAMVSAFGTIIVTWRIGT